MNRLRKLIKEILLESLESFKDATADISFDHDKKDPYFKTDLGRENVKKARAVKQAWAAHSDREFFKDLIKIHWFSNQHMFYHRKSPVNIWLSLVMNFFKMPHDNEISVCGYRKDKDIPIILGWGKLGVEVQGWTTLAANEMDSIASGYHGSSDTDEDSEALRARIAKGPITSFRNDGSSPSFKKNVSRRPSRFGDPYAVDQYALDANSFETRFADSYSPGNELIIDHWTPIRWVIEQEYLTSLMRRPNLEKMNALLSLIEKSNLPLVDLSLTTIDTKALRTALDKKLKADMNLREATEQMIDEMAEQVPIHDAPVTFTFEGEDHGVEMEGFGVTASHPGTDRVGFITAIPYWDELTQHGMSLPKRTMKGHKDVEIYTVDLARLDKIFKGEGLGTQMYKFLIANLSKRNIALVPAEWTRHSDRKSKNSLAVLMMDDESANFPVGERGTSHDALRVWRKLEIPAFYPEWNPDDYSTFQSTRKRGWKDKPDLSRNKPSKEDLDF